MNPLLLLSNSLFRLLIIGFLFNISIFSQNKTSNSMPEDEMIGGNKLNSVREEEGSQSYMRMKKRFGTGVGFDYGNSITSIHFIYNWKPTISIGFTQFFGKLNYYGTTENTDYKSSRFGIVDSAARGTYQNSTESLGVPQMGKALFLQYYPLMSLDIPLYFSFHLGRTDISKIINDSINTPYNYFLPNKSIAHIQTTVNELPDFYYGGSLGYRFIPPGSNLFIGFEYGHVFFPKRNFQFYSRQFLFDKTPLPLSDFLAYDYQIKESYASHFSSKLAINYAIMIGVMF